MKKIRLAFSAALALSAAGLLAGQEGATQKLDAPLLTALKQSREASSDQAALRPDIPVRDGNSVLVDVAADISPALVSHITGIGGKVALSPDAEHIIRAMLPLSQLESLADRADVKSITTARPSFISRMQP